MPEPLKAEDILGIGRNDPRLEKLSNALLEAHKYALFISDGHPVEQKEMLKHMAAYLIESNVIDSQSNRPYQILKEGVADALNIRDEKGDRLRDYKFKSAGWVSLLQRVLVDAETKAANFSNNL